MNNNLKGLLWNSFQQFGNIGLNLLSIIILARLLTPEDYAIYGMIFIFISISEQLTDSGIGGYIIKKQNITDDDYNTLFVYNLGTSIGLYALLFCIAPLISNFYECSTLTNSIRILGIVIILNGLNITQSNKMLRDLKFKELSLISIFVGFLSLIVAIIIAYLGYGVWALIFQNIARSFFSNIVYYIVCRNFIPKLRFQYSLFKEQFAFGINLLISNLLFSFSHNISNNVIAKIFPAQLTGFYTQSSKLQYYPIMIVKNVVDRTFFPIFSRYGDDEVLLNNKSRILRRYMYLVLFLCFTLIICYAKPIVQLLLGSQWIEGTIYFQLLMLSSYPTLVIALNRNVIKSKGRTSLILFTEIVNSISVFVILCIGAFMKDMIVTTLAIAVAQSITVCVSMIILRRTFNVSLRCQIYDVIAFLPNVLAIFLIHWLLPYEYIILFILDFTVLLLLGVGYYFVGVSEYRTIYNYVNTKIRFKRTH